MIHVVLEGQKWSCKIAFRLDCLSKYMENMPRWKAQKNKAKPTMKVRRLSMNVKAKAKARKRPQRWKIPHQKALLTSSSRAFPISDFNALLSDDFKDLSWVWKEKFRAIRCIWSFKRIKLKKIQTVIFKMYAILSAES